MSHDVDQLYTIYHIRAVLCGMGLLETICFRSTSIDEYWVIEDNELSYIDSSKQHA